VSRPNQDFVRGSVVVAVDRPNARNTGRMSACCGISSQKAICQGTG